MPQDLLVSLDEEWQRLVGDPAAHTALCGWRQSGQCSAEAGSLEDLVVLIRSGRAEDRELARALVELASGDVIAARVLLQVLLPSIVGLARRSGRGDPDAAGTIVGLAWIMIRTYPKHRPGDVAANLAWDIRKRYLRTRREHDFPADRTAGEGLVPSAEAVAVSRLGVEDVRSELDRLSGSKLPFALIWSTRVEGRPSSEVARRCGLSRHGLVQRRRRAEQALRSALSV